MPGSNYRTNPLASCLLWLLAVPLLLLWKLHNRNSADQAVRCDGGEGQNNGS